MKTDSDGSKELSKMNEIRGEVEQQGAHSHGSSTARPFQVFSEKSKRYTAPVRRGEVKREVRHFRKFLVGVDEVGRGPLAGPVAVGAVLVSRRMLIRFRDIKESKQLTPLARVEWVTKMETLKSEELRIAVSMVSAATIDRIGIVPAIRQALARSMEKLEVAGEECEVLLDGGLYAPERFIYQRTIIRGDAQETVIAMASVIAKVHRDRYMVRLHKKYPLYDFDQHKGYGTRRHVSALKTHGLSEMHRASFCNFLKSS